MLCSALDEISRGNTFKLLYSLFGPTEAGAPPGPAPAKEQILTAPAKKAVTIYLFLIKDIFKKFCLFDNDIQRYFQLIGDSACSSNIEVFSIDGKDSFEPVSSTK